jgi:hypothetical protein
MATKKPASNIITTTSIPKNNVHSRAVIEVIASGILVQPQVPPSALLDYIAT